MMPLLIPSTQTQLTSTLHYSLLFSSLLLSSLLFPSLLLSSPLLSSTRTFSKAIPGAGAWLKYLRVSETPFLLLTNECRYSNEHLADKLEDCLGTRLLPNEIYSAANSVRDFFRRLIRHGYRDCVYVIGEFGLQENIKNAFEEARKMGLCDELSNARVYTQREYEDLSKDDQAKQRIGYVVVGAVHCENTRNKEFAAKYIVKGAKVVHTCPDYYDADADGGFCFGMPMPTIELLQKTCGCTSYNLGKPNPHMLRMARYELLHTVGFSSPTTEVPYEKFPTSKVVSLLPTHACVSICAYAFLNEITPVAN